MKSKIPDKHLISGAIFRATHRASVISILGEDAPPVHSYGSQFFAVSRWTSRFILTHLCKWAEQNPGQQISQKEIFKLCEEVNNEASPTEKIVIANTPDRMPRALVQALIGGAFHEAWHFYYTKRDDLDPQAICDIILSRWAEIPDWSKLTTILLEWSNIVEDIRIEQLGTKEFPNTYDNMCDLHDFVHEKEKEGLEHIKSHGITHDRKNALTIAAVSFRDKGHGYTTESQAEAWEEYKKENAQAVGLVLHGPLRPLLEEAISLTREDDLGSLRLAFDVVIALYKAAQAKEIDADQEDFEKACSQMEISCPTCNATGDKLTIRPAYNADGKVIPGKGILICSVCGHTEEIPVQFGAGGRGGDPSKKPKFEGWEDIIKQILEDAKEGIKGMKDNNSALKDAIKELKDEKEESLRDGETLYSPFNPEDDSIEYVQPSARGKIHDAQVAKKLRDSVLAEIAALRARLFYIFNANKGRRIYHGVKEGVDLSDRMLVETWIDIKSHVSPNKAFWRQGPKPNLSLASVVVIDESGSMSSWQEDAAKVLLAVTEPLDVLGIPTAAIGFTDSWGHSERLDSSDDESNYHRHDNVRIRIFKDVHEKLSPVLWRFANTQANGSTPMADGIQYAMGMVKHSKANIKFVFVVTDGQPNSGHESVIKHQIRTSKDSNIRIIGVGVGESATFVKTLFEDFVYVDEIQELPRELINKITQLVLRQVSEKGT